jgi:hypothetical protein
MEINFTKNEEYFEDIQSEFNKLLTDSYPECLYWSHYELWKNSGKKFTPNDWKNWRLDERVDDWYNSELLLIVKNRATKLLSKAGDNKSVGETQALNQVLGFLDKKEHTAKQETIFYYCFVPLNIEEEAAENVKIIKNIPNEINDAITKRSRNSKK